MHVYPMRHGDLDILMLVAFCLPCAADPSIVQGHATGDRFERCAAMGSGRRAKTLSRRYTAVAFSPFRGVSPSHPYPLLPLPLPSPLDPQPPNRSRAGGGGGDDLLRKPCVAVLVEQASGSDPARSNPRTSQQLPIFRFSLGKGSTPDCCLQA